MVNVGRCSIVPKKGTTAPCQRLRVEWLLVIAIAGCAKPGPSAEEQVRAAEEENRKVQEEVSRTHRRYQSAISEFWQATSSSEFDRAYDLLAPTYTTMVPRASFVERIKANGAFAKNVDVKVMSTTWQAGSTVARCVLGDLGYAEIRLADTAGGPRISAISLGGMQALPTPP